MDLKKELDLIKLEREEIIKFCDYDHDEEIC
jgi:hypothetical protein